MHSHSSIVQGGISTYVKDLSKEACIKAHETGYLKLENEVLMSGIGPNSSSALTYTAAGTLDSKGKCTGSVYHYGGMTWDYVTVVKTVTLTLKDFESWVNLESNQVHIGGDTQCNYNKGSCMDLDQGHTYWLVNMKVECETTSYNVLYKGTAKKALISTTMSGIVKSETIFTVDQDGTVFALVVKGITSMCMAKAYQTEHNKLLIVPEKYLHIPLFRANLNPRNIDLHTYVNSKFAFLERHTRTQMVNMYQELLQTQCYQERLILHNSLTLAVTHPQQFAYSYYNAPGYTATLIGEAISLVQCQPVELQIRKDLDRCFNEMPVKYLDRDAFLTPRNRIIQYIGTEMACTSLIGPMYQINKVWYSFTPSFHEVKNPHMLQPSKRDGWEYISPSSLAKSGIYTEAELQALQQHILFPSERGAIANTIAKLIYHHDVDTQHLNFGNLLTEDIIESAFSKAMGKVQGFFSLVGQWSSALFGLFLVCKAIKFIIDSIAHGIMLHGILGLSWRLLAMFWDSLTHLCIFLASRTPTTETNNDSTPTTTTPENKMLLKIDQQPIDELSRSSYLYIPTAPGIPNRLESHDP